ncbi:hypothetical protein [Sphaerisporangium krabiense]|uniref:Uncharacterized protein n=1 Tax=Sphaerisporangium krabiense TaxID=763782 RepID=A0A7W9DN93_9ACTN|nr:hypothetical protein [Sphaerisporangium krabiense]MBB5625103.1 hypothetical protein [Sphaerisporangium krabiense]
MSDSLTLGAGSRPATVQASPRWWRRSPYGLPMYAAELWLRRLVPLVLWFSAGELGRFGLLTAGSQLSHGSLREWRLAAVMVIFILMVMLFMVVTVGMLHSLRGALTETRVRRAGGEEPEPLLTGLGRAIIVFVAIYLAWGWQTADAREFSDADMERYAVQYDVYQAKLIMNALAGNGAKPAEPVRPDAGTNLVLDLKVALICTAVALVARYVLSALHERRGGRRLAFGVAFCELAYTFYAAAILVTFADERSAWVGRRAVTTWWNERWAALEETVPGWQGAMEWLGDARPHMVAALLVPLTWLTLAILVYGAYSEDARALIRGTAADRAADALENRTHRMTRRGAGMLVTRAGLDRWPPVLHALRLTLRAGAPLFTVMCLCYVLLTVAADYAERGAYYLIGTAHRQLWWEAYQIPVHFARDLLFTTLTLCLFAATFDIAAARQRAKRSVSAGE